jgi:release factor glutamine methyltransferase
LLAHPEILLSQKQTGTYRRWLKKRATDYPLPYLTSTVEFYGLEFSVTPKVLIPRPETETLVDLALAHKPDTVIDVGTGSGCIAVTIAHKLKQAQVYAVDLSRSALHCARENAHRHGVSDRVHFIQGDLISALRGPVDLIVSNPPYIARSEWESLPASVRWYEPRIALDGGNDGLAVVDRLLEQAARMLESLVQVRHRTAGALLIEIGASMGDKASALARTTVPSCIANIHPDLAGRDRVLEIIPVGETR